MSRTHRSKLDALISSITIAATAGSSALAGCSGLLDVTLPGRVDASALDNPVLAGTLVQSAIADFECAYNNYSALTALLTDEMQHASTTAVIREWDLRLIRADNGSNALLLCGDFGTYTPLQIARFQAEDALRRLESFTDAQVANRSSLMATAAAYAGYAYLPLGEGYCEMAIDGGPLLTPAQVLAIAERRFTQALTLGQTSQNQDAINLARAGRARARLDLQRGNDAVADAQLVPNNFTALVTRDATPARRVNMLWDRNFQTSTFNVDPTFRNLTWQGTPDPRVTVVNAGAVNPSLPGVIVWRAAKVSANSSPYRLASWVEAQLIIAEVTGGQTAVGVINTLHQRAGIPGFSSSDPAEITAQVREERRRELFLEGHRLNDLLRFGLPFPSGPHPIGGNLHGTTTCLPLPLIERTGNPNID